MRMDYKVFEPNNEDLADIIVRILRKRGYDAGYQRSYPQHAVFIKAETKEEAERISNIIEKFMQRFVKEKSGALTIYRYDRTMTKLGKLLPETQERRRRDVVDRIRDDIDKERW